VSRICIIGTGYVGMASGIGLAELGHEVVGYDVLPERIAALQRGVTPYHEEGIESALNRHRIAGSMRFVTEQDDAVRDAKLVLISVGTPAMDDGSCDLTGLRRCIEQLRECDLSACSAVVLRSTVPPGTSDEIAGMLSESAEVIYAPEFLREGSAVGDFLKPDRTVVGASSIPAAIAYAALFEPLNAPIMLTSRRNAELIKAASNAFLALKISFANEIANLCDALGADSLDVLRGVGADRRIGGAFLLPGIGFGGPCFEKDLKSLERTAHSSSVECELVSSTLRVNERQPKRIVDTLVAELGSLHDRTIGVWGLAFKAGTDDIRDSLAIRILHDLAERGALVRAFDPAISDARLPKNCTLVGTALDAADADALLVLTEWPDFRQVSPHAIARNLRANLVVDGRNALDIERIVDAGLRYRGVGRAADPLTGDDLRVAI
jgi:UDPglucose 6-dehydrogenase